MRGSRFIVLRMSHITRTAVIALAALIAVIALVIVVLPKNRTRGAFYIPGTYASHIILHSKPVSVSVTVDEFAITAIEMSPMEESIEVFYPLFKPTMEELAREIIKKQTTNVQTTVDTMYTSRILLDAVNSALAKASSGDVAVY